MKKDQNLFKNLSLVAGGVVLARISDIIKAVASFKCYVLLAMLAVIAVAAYTLFANKKVKREINKLGRTVLFTATLVVCLFFGIKHYMSHVEIEDVKGDEAIVEVVDIPVEEKTEEVVVEEKQEETNTNTNTNVSLNTRGYCPEEEKLQESKLAETTPETKVDYKPENINFEFDETADESNIQLIIDDEESTDDEVVQQKEENKEEVIIEKEIVDNSTEIDSSEEDNEKVDINDDNGDQAITNGTLISFDEDKEVNEEVNEEVPSNVMTLDVVEEETEENTQTIDETKKEEVKEEIKEEVKVEEKELTVSAVDGYTTLIGSSVQFIVSDANATIDGLDGFDYNFSNGVLTVEAGEEATVLTVEVSSGSQVVTFDITINGIVG